MPRAETTSTMMERLAQAGRHQLSAGGDAWGTVKFNGGTGSLTTGATSLVGGTAGGRGGEYNRATGVTSNGSAGFRSAFADGGVGGSKIIGGGGGGGGAGPFGPGGTGGAGNASANARQPPDNTGSRGEPNATNCAGGGGGGGGRNAFAAGGGPGGLGYISIAW